MNSKLSTQYYYFFDLDGTLCNSEEFSTEALRLTIKEITGQTISSKAAFQYSFGKCNHDIVKTVCADFSLATKHEVLLRTMKKYFKQLRDQSSTQFLIEPTVALFKKLIKHNQPVCIVSGSDLADILYALQFMDVTCDLPIVGNETYQYGKPHPEPYHIAARKFNLTQDQYHHVIVFEDSPAGVRAAHKAGMHVIGLQSASLDDALIKHGAHAVVFQKDIGVDLNYPAKFNLIDWLNNYLNELGKH